MMKSKHSMRKWNRITITFLSFLIICSLIIPAIPTVKATAPTIIRVFAPTAQTETDVYGALFGYGKATTLDNNVLALGPFQSLAVTTNFTYPNYAPFWPPYANRTFFPTSDATILSLSIVAIVRCTVPRWFTLGMWCTGSSPSDTQFVLNSPAYDAGPDPQLFTYNVTALASPALDPLVLTDKAGDLRVFLYAGTETRALYVDYIGIDFNWTSPTIGINPGSPESENGYLGFPSANGLMGLMGFVGLIATPAFGIIYARNAGGMKALIAVITMGGFCLAMLVVSLGI